MKNKYNIIFLLCISLLISSASFAGLEIKAASPQAVDGNISFAEADSFQIDILINITDENSELCGGGFAFELFSPDKSIESITHLTVTDGYASTESIEYLNGFNTDIFNVATITCENGWGGNGNSKSIGDLPDSISFVLAGIGCLSSSLPDQEYIRFNLRCSNPGTICIDSISNSADDLWDWLFESRWDPVTFDGPYCWTILSQSNDTPPDITCPGDVTIESGSSTAIRPPVSRLSLLIIQLTSPIPTDEPFRRITPFPRITPIRLTREQILNWPCRKHRIGISAFIMSSVRRSKSIPALTRPVM